MKWLLQELQLCKDRMLLAARVFASASLTSALSHRQRNVIAQNSNSSKRRPAVPDATRLIVGQLPSAWSIYGESSRELASYFLH
eukprot:1854005-Pleurochrysis_carterae.AAC.4